ncbi:hypothetical protein EJ02DRAFT_486052 [Clathrospora elynae]|uniref:Autophagy-related protein 29 n=1 Tax=Clathrospora elynae TaxID=706981 RepID=A0A6A5T5C2_9PLEO|nr:hypothetical protein EJ02DRAFT_486052 [Clathrospora elynae]
MSSVQFTALIRLPFFRGDFEDPPQAQWDAEKDRQLWKVISKSSKTSDLNWVELADKFQVPPTFLLQQAAWLYERHLDHVRNQMKKVSIGNANPSPSPTGGSTLTAVGGVAMRRGGSAGSGAGRAASALSGRPRDSPSLRGGEIITPVPPLSRTPSTNTITQSRTHTQVPGRTLSTRSTQRPNLATRKSHDRPPSSSTPPPNFRNDAPESPDIPDSSSSSSSSLSDTDHPVHRSQLFKRPPRFQQKRPRDLSTFEEGDDAEGIDDSGSHGTSLPFASAARRQSSSIKYAQEAQPRTSGKSEKKASLPDRTKNVAPMRQKSIDQQLQATTETASSMTSSASASDAQAGPASAKSPISPPFNHRAELGRLGSPRGTGLRSRKEGSEGTPSMGSSFSDIDDAGISQSALEEALLSNMQHGRMTCSRNLTVLCIFTTTIHQPHQIHITLSDPSISTKMTQPPPILHISDHTTHPPPTLLYISGANELSLATIYPLIKSLLTHPPCAHRRSPTTWPCQPCEAAFTSLHWTCCAYLLDYFADFYATDTPTMHSVWFYLFDVWQEGASWLPVEEVLDDAVQNRGGVWGTYRAEVFGREVREALLLFQTVMWGRRKEGNSGLGTGESVIYRPSGERHSPVGPYETGPWISGLKPWTQFLCDGSPGVAAPAPASAPAPAPIITSSNTTDTTSAGEQRTHQTTRYIPLPALALLKTHTSRARALLHKHTAQTDPDTLTEALHTFDQNALAFPSKNDAHTYTSLLTGLRTTYTLVNGAPPISRYPGYGDPSMLVEEPDWNLLDECVGVCRGVEAYEAQAGEEEEEMEGMEEDVFDMWTVVESAGAEEEEGGGDEGGGEGEMERNNLAEGFGDMFEDWCGVDEF